MAWPPSTGLELMDPKMIEPCRRLNELGIETVQSCQGHIANFDDGRAAGPSEVTVPGHLWIVATDTEWSVELAQDIAQFENAFDLEELAMFWCREDFPVLSIHSWKILDVCSYLARNWKRTDG